MNLSAVILVCSCVLLVSSLLHCFLGYKLARFLLPISGFLLVEGLLYIFVFGQLVLNAVSTWLFFIGSGIAIYLLLFFLKRAAGFFTGLAAGGLFTVFAVYAAGLQTISLIIPIGLTICVVMGLLTVVFHRVAVVVSTSIAGGCAAAYSGLYLYIVGVDAANIVVYDNLLVPFEVFLKNNAYLISGVSLVLIAVGIFVQLRWTAKKQLLSIEPEYKPKFQTRNGFVDSL